MRRTAVAVAAIVTAAAWAGAGDDVVMKAMRDELARSMAELEMENLSAPYFIAYRIDEVLATDTAASFGSLLRDDERAARSLSVEVRVGKPALDNTNFLSMSGFGGPMGRPLGGARLPLENDYQEIRRQIWLATDAAYKQALEDLAKKKAALQNKTRTDELPDFRPQEKARVRDGVEPEPLLVDHRVAERMVRDQSALFRDMPGVFSSTVRLTTRVRHSRLVSSEGSELVRTLPLVRWVATASTQAADGMSLFDAETAYGRALTDLPEPEVLERRIEALGGRLAALRSAELLDTFNGPVLFEGQAAAELLAQGFVPQLLATRRPVVDNPRMEMFLDQGESPFLDKIGARVLPRSVRLVDDPTLETAGEVPLLGGYPVDDDGVPASPTVVVERGRLKTLLATRNPVRGLASTTGNRRGAGVAPSNLLLTSTGGLTTDELREELLALVADGEHESGVVVRRIVNPVLAAAEDQMAAMFRIFRPGGQGKDAVQPLVEAYRVYPDGREQLLRNVRLSDLGAAAFKDIVAIGDTPTVTTMPFQQRGGSPFAALALAGRPGDNAPLVSIVTPALLFEELTLVRPTGEFPKPPVAPHPFFAAQE